MHNKSKYGRHFPQTAENAGKYAAFGAFSGEELEQMAELAGKYVEKVTLRGME